MTHDKSVLVLCVILFSSVMACSQLVDREGMHADRGKGKSTPNFVAVAKTLQPTVVNVSATISPTKPGSDQSDQPRDQFFGVPRPPRANLERSQGSGFIIGSDGVILTNAHIVEDATKITVRLSDKREFGATVVGKDLHTDVAVIKIAVKDSLPTLQLGNSDQLEIGEWVMAVGNPFGLDNSLSSGIVSAKGRFLGDAYDRLIQTDANLNPGSSGGPLVDLNGSVVGINKAIVTQGGGNLGIGFATPINLVKEILPQLQSEGKVTRGWVGLMIQEITPALAETMGLQEPRGALVAGIVRGSPAERGGIKVGDVITEFDGQRITDALSLPLWIARTPINREVGLTLRRDNQEMRVNVTVAELPGSPTQAKSGATG